jgi:hypothetical protein
MVHFVEVPASPQAAAVYTDNFKAPENKRIVRGLGLVPDDLKPVVLFGDSHWKLLGIDIRRHHHRIVLRNLANGKIIAADEGIVPLIGAARAGYRARQSA